MGPLSTMLVHEIKGFVQHTVMRILLKQEFFIKTEK